jgi:hypothetical protein
MVFCGITSTGEYQLEPADCGRRAQKRKPTDSSCLAFLQLGPVKTPHSAEPRYIDDIDEIDDDIGISY